MTIRRNVAGQHVRVSVIAQATGQRQLNPTIAAGDFQRSIDGAGQANMTTLPVVGPAGWYTIDFALSQAETNCDELIIIGHDVAGAEWDDIEIRVYPTAAIGTDGRALLSADAQTGVTIPTVTNTGTVTGNVNGNIAGNLGGNVVGNINGNLVGNVQGNINGTLANCPICNCKRRCI